MVSRDGPLGGNEVTGWRPREWESPYERRRRELAVSLWFLPCEDGEQRRGLSPDTESAGALILGLDSLQSARGNVCCPGHPVCSVQSRQPALRQVPWWKRKKDDI